MTMDIKYIVLIVAGALFLILFLTYIILAFQKKKREALKRQRIEQMYADKNLVKMEYDFLTYDEETEKLFAAQAEHNSQSPHGNSDAANGAIFQTVDTDGLEEIVGNYKPE